MPIMPTGDKGQRYEIKCSGYPFEGETVIGWCEQLDGAERMTRSILRAPGAKVATIRDRWKATPAWGASQTFIIYGGVLR